MADRFAWWFMGAAMGLFLMAYLFVTGKIQTEGG